MLNKGVEGVLFIMEAANESFQHSMEKRAQIGGFSAHTKQTLTRDIVYGVPLEGLWRLVIMVGWLVLGTAITLRFFKWE